MIDSHCHLTDPRLANQLEPVLSRARTAGVVRFVTIGTDVDDSEASAELCRGRADVRCVVGIHPNYANEAAATDLDRLRALERDPSVVALGEMGLDYHYDRVPRDVQRRFFLRQLEHARETARPVVIHCREAVDDTLAIFADFPGVPAVFHCFTGSATEARRIVGAGFNLGFTGPITYKKNDALRAVVLETPLDRILIETDAPYLSPEPVRGQKVNEPGFVSHVLRRLAAIKSIPLHEADAATTANTQRFYRWGAGA